MKITWLGTACVRIEAEGERLLFDPFVQLLGGENPNCIDDFRNDSTIFITHGHLDHLLEVPELLDTETGTDATVFCGQKAADTLEKIVEDSGNAVIVKPGDVLRIGGVTVRVWEGKHARPGVAAGVKKLFSGRLFHHLKNALALAYLHPKFPEGGQTLIYEVCAEGKRVLVMGSLGPKRIMLDHFDDAFPPVSESVDTRGFKKLMDREYPHIRVVKPTAGKTVEI